jgi:hypothetical protein
LRDVNGDPERNRKRKIKRLVIYISVSLLLLLYSVPFILSTKSYCDKVVDNRLTTHLKADPGQEEDLINKM